MNVTLANAVVNAEVTLTSSKYGNSGPNGNNPVGGATKGTIFGIQSPWIAVKWANGTINHYEDDTLSFVNVPAAQADKPEAKIVLTLTPTATVATPIAATPARVTPITLQAAIERVINEKFVSKNLTFSGYDITSSLRREVNEGRIVIENIAFEKVNNINTQKITHEDVRKLARAYANTLLGYKAEFNGDYVLYSPRSAAPVPLHPSPAPAARPLIFTPTSQAATATPAPSKVRANPSAKLITYIKNKGPRSLKQIQSRFKVKGDSQHRVRDIAQIAQSSGLRIDIKTPYYRSVVTT